MAIELSKVIKSLSDSCDAKKIENVEKYIDDQLVNPEYCVKAIQGPIEDFYFKFSIFEYLNIHEINSIRSKYIDSGWGKVIIESRGECTDIYLLKNNNTSFVINNGV